MTVKICVLVLLLVLSFSQETKEVEPNISKEPKIEKIPEPVGQVKKNQQQKTTQQPKSEEKLEVDKPVQPPKVEDGKVEQKKVQPKQQNKSEDAKKPENQVKQSPKEQEIQPPKSNVPSVPENPNQQQQAHIPAPLPEQKVPETPKFKANPQAYCGKQAYLRRSVKKSQGRMILVPTIYDFDMYVDSKDYSVSNLIANTGTWQPHYINLIGHIVKPGYKVLNLGSQSGLEALVMGKIIGPEGKLFIFEPYTFSHSLVTKNIEINGLKDITTIYKVGASDEKTTGVIQVFFSNTGGSEISTIQKRISAAFSSPPPTVGQLENVQTDRVDALLPADVKLDFALIDVEKMQVKALRGMKQIIDRSPNLVIMTQWQYASNRFSNKEQTTQLLNYFIDKGYKIYMYTGGDIVKCTVGAFYEIKDINELFRLNLVDLFLFPKTVELPK